MHNLLAVIARDPVPPAYLATTDQVQAHRTAESYLQILDEMGHIKLLNDPNAFERHDDEAISSKKVPTVKELIAQAHNACSKAHYFGFVNADIILAPHFIEDLLRAKNDSMEGVLLQRTDVDNLAEVGTIVKSKNPREIEIGKKVNPHNSADGIFLTPRVILSFLAHYPDFVIAEPWWDTAAIYWASQSKYPFLCMRENQALHVKHPQQWSFRNPGARRARNLYTKLMETWPLE